MKAILVFVILGSLAAVSYLVYYMVKHLPKSIFKFSLFAVVIICIMVAEYKFLRNYV